MNNQIADKERFSEDLVFEDAQSDPEEEEKFTPSTAYNNNGQKFNPTSHETNSKSITNTFKSSSQETDLPRKQNDITSSKSQFSKSSEINSSQNKTPLETFQTTSYFNGSAPIQQHSTHLQSTKFSPSEIKLTETRDKDYYLKGLHDTYKSPTANSELKSPVYSSPDYNALKTGYSSAKNYTPDPQVQRHIDTLKKEFIGGSRSPYESYKFNGTSSYTQSLSSQYTSSRPISDYVNAAARTDFLSSEARSIINNSRSTGNWPNYSSTTNPMSNYGLTGLKEGELNQSFTSGLDSRSVVSQSRSVVSQTLNSSYPLKKSIIDPALEAKVQKITEDILRRSSTPETLKENKYLSSSPIISRYDPTKNNPMSPLLTQSDLRSGARTPEKYIPLSDKKSIINSQPTATTYAAATESQRLAHLYESTVKNLLKNEPPQTFHTIDSSNPEISQTTDSKYTRPSPAADKYTAQSGLGSSSAGTSVQKRGFAAKLKGLCRKKKSQTPIKPTKVQAPMSQTPITQSLPTQGKAVKKRPLLKRYQPQIVCLFALIFYLIFIIYLHP